MRVTKSDITLQLDCWVDELSPAQLAAYEKVANEHNAIKNALKSALNQNDGKELFNGQVFQAYSFKGKVLQEFKEATLPKKPPKPVEAPPATPQPTRGRKRTSNLVYLESSDEADDDDVPLAKRLANSKKNASVAGIKPASTQKQKPLAGKASPPSAIKNAKTPTTAKTEKTAAATSPPQNFRPSEISSVGGLVIGTTDNKETNPKDVNDTAKDIKLQGKTFPSLVVLAKPWLKVRDMSNTRSKLDSKVKLVLMLTPNKFTEWLIQEGLLKSEQKCANHRTNELKLGVYSDATKFPYTGGYVWISECCPTRFVSVFHGSIFEGAPHPPSCILKLIYHWSCQTNIQNVVQWVKVDNVYIKGVYTWLRAICTLAVHQKCKKLGGPEKFVEVGVISLGTTSQDGQQRQVKVEVLGVLDYSEKTIRLRAVEPVSDVDRNYKKRFQTILEPLQRWVHKESSISIDLTVDKMTLYSMGFKNIVQAAATDSTAVHTNSAVMDYLRRIVPRMFQNTLSLLSRQMIQQFLDELVWREQFGTYALQAFTSITAHIAEQTRMNTQETLTQRLYQVATNPFKDWSVLPANYKETPVNTTPKRLKKPINEADYVQSEKVIEKPKKQVKKEKDDNTSTPAPTGKKRGPVPKDKGNTEKKNATTDAAVTKSTSKAQATKQAAQTKNTTTKVATKVKSATPAKIATPTKPATPAKNAEKTTAPAKNTPVPTKQPKQQPIVETKLVKKEEDDLKGLEEMYYGIRDGSDRNFESFPFTTEDASKDNTMAATNVECPICNIEERFDSNEKLQTHLVSHISPDGKEHQFQCLFCLEKHASEAVLSKHNQIMHPSETKISSSPSYHCLICQQRFNSLHHLTVHLQKIHNMLELPYCCYACNYRSSSHRDVVRHFYDDHRNQNFLQCPFCLDIFRFSYKGRVSVSNIENYYMHLRQHVGKKDTQQRCQKCALIFVNKGALKQHLVNHHGSFAKSPQNVRLLLNNSLLIPLPKIRSHHREPQPFTMVTKTEDFFAFIDGSVCAECNSEIISEEHFGGNLKCNKCNYKTYCERAMYNHAVCCATSTTSRDAVELPLPNELHCICGFWTANGNMMAHHLATCGHKSAYPTLEIMQENTIKRNMLDMLGLMRRDGDAGADGEEPNQNNSTVGDVSSIGSQQEKFSTSYEASDGSMLLNSNDQGTSLAESVEQQHYTPIVDGASDQQQQYQLGFGQPEVQNANNALTASDIDMPLIGELADPNPPATPQFLGEVHTPMFDAAAAAEQQHYHQMMQQQPQNQSNQ